MPTRKRVTAKKKSEVDASKYVVISTDEDGVETIYGADPSYTRIFAMSRKEVEIVLGAFEGRDVTAVSVYKLTPVALKVVEPTPGSVKLA